MILFTLELQIIHYMSEFPAIFAEGSVNLNFIIQIIYKISTSYSQNFFELLLILLILFYSLKKTFKNQKSHIFYLLTLFLIFILNFNQRFRGGNQYHLYYSFCYLIVIACCLDKLDLKISNIFLTLIIVIFIYNNSLIKQFSDHNSKINIFERQNSLIEICKEFRYGIPSKRYDATINYIKYWHQKFDDKTIKSLCKELKL